MVKLVIFDMDDTLYDEVDYCRSGFNAAARYLSKKSHLPDSVSVQAIADELWHQFTAGNTTRTFNAALDKFDLPYDMDLIKRLITAYREHKPRINLPYDSKMTLDTLSQQYDLALLTDGFLPAQRLKVKALDIEKYFKCIVFTEEMGREYWKPHPAGFEKILKKLAVEPCNAVYFADNVAKDFIAPNKLGMSSIRLIRPNGVHHGEPASPEAAPDHTITDIKDLPGLLEKL
ncbi:phosphoglycolate phosphatase [Anaerohalosphaera lusitana]|uniref:Phosphoglycolate phosphatase n=1 Tax=Anaerohalosphaera lusitana TaxID=1936003 RepID=A0A1U9NP67_9BACT|nr:HAD family hydrolase [Anaerohalosphaera lusitana]AQT69534.1 phosphoglycolate phosphatase [Anaerohalosphaera lusitana]